MARITNVALQGQTKGDNKRIHMKDKKQAAGLFPMGSEPIPVVEPSAKGD